MQLKDLFISKVRVKLLQVFLSNPGRIFYVRELVREVKEQINAVRAELARMEKAGLLTSENRANRKYFGLRREYLFYDELLRMVAKTRGLGGEFIKEKGKLGRLRYAFLSSIFVKKLPSSGSDVDLFVVGNIVLPQLASIVKEAEDEIGREVNYSVMSEEEFKFRKHRRDPFVVSLLEKPKLMLIGDEDEMLKV